MIVRLVVEQGGQRKVVPWNKDVAVLGRAHGNVIRIPSAEVSRQHCRLSRKNGLVVVRDLGSVNGTNLNGVRIKGEEIVRPGDKLGVGPVVFTVEYDLSPEALNQLRSLNDSIEVLEALADGEVVDYLVEDDVAGILEELEEVEDLDEVQPVLPATPLPAEKPKKKPVKPVEKVAPVDDNQGLIPVDFDFDAQAWELPDANDLRSLMDGADETDTPPRKTRPKK